MQDLCYAMPIGVITHRLRAAAFGECVGSSYQEFKKGSPTFIPAGNKDSFEKHPNAGCKQDLDLWPSMTLKEADNLGLQWVLENVGSQPFCIFIYKWQPMI